MAEVTGHNRPRILVVGPRGLFGYEGGIEKFADAFLPRAINHADIDVLSLFPPRQDCPKGLEVIQVPKSKRFKTDKALYLLYALYYYAMRPYDHVFIMGTNFAVLIPFMKAMIWRKAKIHLRSGSVDYMQDKWGRGMKVFMRCTERLCRLADTVIAVAPNIKRHLEGQGVQAVLVRNGLEKQLPSESDGTRKARTVLAVGRVTPPKNYAALIKAAARLGAEGPKITVIGGADLSDESVLLKQMVADNPTARIEFAGVQPRDTVMQAFQSYALYVNCSVQEGMSNAVLEAIQNRIPIILSDIEANRDFDLSDHFYFDPRDDAALADKITDALNNPKRYTVDPDRYDNWDAAIDKILHEMKVVKL